MAGKNFCASSSRHKAKLIIDDNATLTALQAEIESAGLQTRLAEPSEEVPVPQLLVFLSETLSGQSLRCEIMVLPDLPDPPVLQLFVPLPLSLHPGSEGDVARLLHMLNNAMPLLGFGMLESGPEVYFRLLLPYRDGALDGEVVVKTLFVIGACVSTFGELVEDLATGELSLDEASNDLKAVLENLDSAE